LVRSHVPYILGKHNSVLIWADKHGSPSRPVKSAPISDQISLIKYSRESFMRMALI
jgi:hypothetical protein